MTLDRLWATCRVCAIICGMAAAMSSALAQTPDAAAPGPSIAAASDLQFALTEIAADFRRDTGRRSGWSSDRRATSAGRSPRVRRSSCFCRPTRPMSRRWQRRAAPRMAVSAMRPGASCCSRRRVRHSQPDPTLADLKAAVADGRVRHFAIANPEHAPYGRAASEALQAAGLWDALVPRLVLGENVSAGGAIRDDRRRARRHLRVFAGAARRRFADKGDYVLLPRGSHAPLHQRMVLVKGAGATAREFYRYLQAPAARAVFDALRLHAAGRVSAMDWTAFALSLELAGLDRGGAAPARARRRPRPRLATVSRGGAGSRRRWRCRWSCRPRCWASTCS